MQCDNNFIMWVLTIDANIEVDKDVEVDVCVEMSIIGCTVRCNVTFMFDVVMLVLM